MMSQVPSIVLALQLAEGGELFDFMVYTGSFNETMARTLFRQLLSALQVRSLSNLASALQLRHTIRSALRSLHSP